MPGSSSSESESKGMYQFIIKFTLLPCWKNNNALFNLWLCKPHEASSHTCSFSINLKLFVLAGRKFQKVNTLNYVNSAQVIRAASLYKTHVGCWENTSEAQVKRCMIVNNSLMRVVQGWFNHSILCDFETRVLRMVRAIYRMRFATWNLDLAFSRFCFHQTLFLGLEQVIKDYPTCLFLRFEKQNFCTTLFGLPELSSTIMHMVKLESYHWLFWMSVMKVVQGYFCDV